MSYLPAWLQGKPEHEVPADQVNEITNHICRQSAARVVANRFDDLPTRVRMFKALSGSLPGNRVVDPTMAAAGGVEDRADLKVMGRWGTRSAEARTAREHGVAQAQALIDSNMRSISYEDFRRGTFQPGPTISADKPGVIRW